MDLGPDTETNVTLHIYDTMQRQKVQFVPRTEGQVAMYVCGPTVYDVPHLGHGRTSLTYDVIRRYLEWTGWNVTVASNVTDIDDKIIKRAEAEGRTEPEVAAEFSRAYDEQMQRLDILPAQSRPHATEFIEGMIDIISELVAKDAAYVVPDKGVYFSVQGLSDYGRLAGRDLDQLLEDAGQRVDVDAEKRSPIDFALWKSAKSGEPSWDTPWGSGRPGWHTECVAMSLSALGPGFDIHGGGDDLCFPHHQNEWAQVTAIGKPFARYWVHSAMVNVGGEKMSKSLGNFTTINKLLLDFDGESIRYALLQGHYRAPLSFSGKTLTEAKKSLSRLYRSVDGFEINGDPDQEIMEYLYQDLNTPKALARAHYLAEQANKGSKECGQQLKNSSKVLGILSLSTNIWFKYGKDIEDNNQNLDVNISDEEINKLILKRKKAKDNRDFHEADLIREKLLELNIILEDKPDITTWRKS